jgi:hypothetical protein
MVLNAFWLTSRSLWNTVLSWKVELGPSWKDHDSFLRSLCYSVNKRTSINTWWRISLFWLAWRPAVNWRVRIWGRKRGKRTEIFCGKCEEGSCKILSTDWQVTVKRLSRILGHDTPQLRVQGNERMQSSVFHFFDCVVWGYITGNLEIMLWRFLWGFGKLLPKLLFGKGCNNGDYIAFQC